MSNTVWPKVLDMSEEDARKVLRALELQAYSAVVTALRAQGDLSANKRNVLRQLQVLLGVNPERHRAEIRRSVNDESLSTVAFHIAGENHDLEWQTEGRRPLSVIRGTISNKSSNANTANNAASQQREKNTMMCQPSATGNKNNLMLAATSLASSATSSSPANSSGVTTPTTILSSIVTTTVNHAPVTKYSRPSSPSTNVVVLPSGTSIHIKGGLDIDGDEDITGAKRRRISTSDSFIPSTTKPLIGRNQASPQMRITLTKPVVSTPPTQKVILVSSQGQSIDSSSSNYSTVSHKSHLQSGVGNSTVVPIVRQSTPVMSHTRTSVVYPAGSNAKDSSSSTGPTLYTQQGGVTVHQRARGKTVSISSPKLTIGSKPSTTLSVSRPGMVIPVGSNQLTSTRTLNTAGGLMNKPGIHIKQEGVMKIITTNTSKQLLPKPSNVPNSSIVVVTSALAHQSTSVVSSPHRSVITTTNTTQGGLAISSGKVVSINTGKVISTMANQLNKSSSNSVIQNITASSPAAAADTHNAGTTTLRIGNSKKSANVVIVQQSSQFSSSTASKENLIKPKTEHITYKPQTVRTASGQAVTVSLQAKPGQMLSPSGTLVNTAVKGNVELSRPSILAGLIHSESQSAVTMGLSPSIIQQVSPASNSATDEAFTAAQTLSTDNLSQTVQQDTTTTVTTTASEVIDIFSSALAEAEINLDPYEFADEDDEMGLDDDIQEVGCTDGLYSINTTSQLPTNVKAEWSEPSILDPLPTNTATAAEYGINSSAESFVPSTVEEHFQSPLSPHVTSSLLPTQPSGKPDTSSENVPLPKVLPVVTRKSVDVTSTLMTELIQAQTINDIKTQRVAEYSKYEPPDLLYQIANENIQQTILQQSEPVNPNISNQSKSTPELEQPSNANKIDRTNELHDQPASIDTSSLSETINEDLQGEFSAQSQAVVSQTVTVVKETISESIVAGNVVIQKTAEITQTSSSVTTANSVYPDTQDEKFEVVDKTQEPGIEKTPPHSLEIEDVTEKYNDIPVGNLNVKVMDSTSDTVQTNIEAEKLGDTTSVLKDSDTSDLIDFSKSVENDYSVPGVNDIQSEKVCGSNNNEQLGVTPIIPSGIRVEEEAVANVFDTNCLTDNLQKNDETENYQTTKVSTEIKTSVNIPPAVSNTGPEAFNQNPLSNDSSKLSSHEENLVDNAFKPELSPIISPNETSQQVETLVTQQNSLPKGTMQQPTVVEANSDFVPVQTLSESKSIEKVSQPDQKKQYGKVYHSNSKSAAKQTVPTCSNSTSNAQSISLSSQDVSYLSSYVNPSKQQNQSYTENKSLGLFSSNSDKLKPVDKSSVPTTNKTESKIEEGTKVNDNELKYVKPTSPKVEKLKIKLNSSVPQNSIVGEVRSTPPSTPPRSTENSPAKSITKSPVVLLHKAEYTSPSAALNGVGGRSHRSFSDSMDSLDNNSCDDFDREKNVMSSLSNDAGSQDEVSMTDDETTQDPTIKNHHRGRKRKRKSDAKSWIKPALGLVKRVMSYRGPNRNKGEHGAAAWFLRPVTDDEAPGYSAVIETPMDFGTVKRKLETQQYATIEDFHKDTMLIYTNCCTYNPPEHNVRRDCETVFLYFNQEYDKLIHKLHQIAELKKARTSSSS